ncbi:MAG: LysM peptidoglycan-binding domain-containing protein [Rhizobiaceae bacterium]
MNIEIQQPQPFDLVGGTILIAGNAVGFEGHLSVNVTEGHADVTGSAGAGSTSIRKFQAHIDIPPDTPFQLNRLFLTLTDDSGGEDGVPKPQATVPVLYGPMILPGYTDYFEHTVAAGDTLVSISTQYYGEASKVSDIQQANQHIVPDANLIFVDQVLRIPRND